MSKSDLAHGLRRLAEWICVKESDEWHTLLEAADEIERLQKENKALSEQHLRWVAADRELTKERYAMRREIEGLRAILREAISQFPNDDGWLERAQRARDAGADRCQDKDCPDFGKEKRFVDCACTNPERLCPHGLPLSENTCGPCSEGRPMRLRP